MNFTNNFCEAGFWEPDDMYYHSIMDTPEMVDANSLKAVSDITAVAVIRIANLETLPYSSE